VSTRDERTPEDVRDALTAEEWRGANGGWVRRSDCEYEWDASDDQARHGFAILARCGAVQIEHPSDRHALAALALHGQPFGFTHADVGALRRCYEADWQGVPSPNDGDVLLSIAARIAALLPPEEGETP